MRQLVLISSVLFLSIAGYSFADVPAKCRNVYSEAGAVPFTNQCFILAASAGVDLGTYACTATEEYVTEYCNTLPTYDEGETDEDEDTDSSENGTSDEGEGDENDETDDGPLPTYDETNDDSYTECDATENSMASSNGTFDFTTTQGWQFLDGPLGQYSNVVSLVNLFNLADSAVEANESGDTARVFENIYGMVFPLLPYDSAVGAAFQEFSNFTDRHSNEGC